ncbi:hypothetical protein GCM10007049_25800 [Echinicola pacifica]|uniref:Uncharacterized protein n=2 Tax=Echinicola pacifica TaxID=346377 RepID=A0A918Q5K0_9BACT|nr:hypothetical protein GCM10007049_25800 [Echinicola pacifica]
MSNKSVIKYSLALVALLWTSSIVSAQTVDSYFNQAAKHYVHNDYRNMGQALAEGLQKYPQDPKLNALKDKLEEEQEKQDQQQKEDQKNQDQQDQDKQDQQDQQQGDQKQQDQEQQQSQESKDGEGDEQTQEDGAENSEEMQEKKGQKSQDQDPSDQNSNLDSDLSEREKAMEELKQKLQQMNISPQQAQQILDAMDNAELQYIQQTRKKPTKRPDKGLPDW